MDNILLSDVEIPSLNIFTDLRIKVSKTLKWSLNIQTNIVKARSTFHISVAQCYQFFPL